MGLVSVPHTAQIPYLSTVWCLHFDLEVFIVHLTFEHYSIATSAESLQCHCYIPNILIRELNAPLMARFSRLTYIGTTAFAPRNEGHNYGNKKARHLCWWTGIRTAIYGARGGRTLTVLLPKDFKSFASADSAIAPAGVILPKKPIHALFFRAILKKSTA